MEGLACFQKKQRIIRGEAYPVKMFKCSKNGCVVPFFSYIQDVYLYICIVYFSHTVWFNVNTTRYSLDTQCVHTSHTLAASNMSKGACRIWVETIWKESWFPGSTVEAVKNIGHDIKSLTVTVQLQVIEKSLPVKAQDIRWILGQLQLWVEGFSFLLVHFWIIFG